MWNGHTSVAQCTHIQSKHFEIGQWLKDDNKTLFNNYRHSGFNQKMTRVDIYKADKSYKCISTSYETSWS